MYDQMIFGKSAEIFIGERTIFLTNDAGKTGYQHAKY